MCIRDSRRRARGRAGYDFRRRAFYHPRAGGPAGEEEVFQKEEGEELRGHGDAFAARRLVSIRLPSRSLLPAISQPILQRLQRVRCALRALMMPISLSILLPFHLGRVIEIHGDIFVSNANVFHKHEVSILYSETEKYQYAVCII